MKNIYLLIGMILTCIILISCTQNDKPDPMVAVDEFITSWTGQEFNSMYEHLSTEAKNRYQQQDFINRHTEIYENINVDHLDISATPLTDDGIKTAQERGEATVHLSIAFETIAGPIDFDKDLELNLHETDDKSSWKMNWNEGFILPGLENDGEVSIEKTESQRGEILDRNKMPLALNDIAYEIGIIPEEFLDESSEKREISELLDISVDKIDKNLNMSWVEPDYFVPLSVLPATEETKLNQLEHIPSASYKETSGRTYPLGPAAAHLTGYVGKITDEELAEYPKETYTDNDIIGKNGLEQMYEEQLHGEDGTKISIVTESETGSKEQELIAEKPVKDGENIQLTIDVNIQEKIFQAYDGRPGTSAAVHPKTGEVLALISSPAYDPDELTYGITENRWNHLTNDQHKPFTNRFRATFAPGSAIKPITAAVGLANGTINFDEGITIDGLTWGKKSWNGAEVTRVSTSEKPVTLEDALTRSDNIYFAMQAVDMGSDKFIKGMKSFGVTEKLPFEFPIQNSQISNDDKLDEILLANTSYGQGEIEMSALHLALAYTVFLNEGNMLKPNILLDKKDSTIWKEDLINENQAEQMKSYLRNVVQSGTAKNANDDDLPISGKTGTAELKQSKGSKGQQNGWFVGYPTDDEDIMIAMMIEEVEHVGSSGYVAGKVKDVLKKIN